MNNRIKTTLLEVLVVIIFITITNFIEIDGVDFCMGAVYILILDTIENNFRKE